MEWTKENKRGRVSVTEERGARGDKRMMPSSTYLYIKGEREKGMLLAVFLALASSAGTWSARMGDGEISRAHT